MRTFFVELVLVLTIAVNSLPRSPSILRAKTPSSYFPPLRGQSLDYTSLSLSVEELKSTFVPGKVENVLQDNEYNLYLGVKTLTGINLWLQFCWHPSTARIGWCDAPPRAETSPYSFASTLRALLKSLTITKITIPHEFDRIVEVELSERLSDVFPKWKLILEVMGSRSNLVLVSPADNVIQAVAYQVGTGTTVRPLQTNGIYQSPPSGGGIFSPLVKSTAPPATPTTLAEASIPSRAILPYTTFAFKLTELKSLTVEKALISVYRGMSPNIARSILFHAQVMDDVIVSTLTEEQLQQLYRYFAAWASLFLEDSVHGAVRHPRIVHYDRHNRNVSEYVPIAFTDHTMTSMTNELSIYSDNTSVSSFLTRFYTLQERQNEFIALRTACTKKLLIRQKKATKMLDDFKSQVADASGEKADDLKLQGDLVTSYTHTWVDKDPTLQCYDFVTGNPILVEIPYGSSPSDHAQRLYKKAKKLKRSLIVLDNLLMRTQQHIAYLNEIDASLGSLHEYTMYEDIVTLRDIDDELNELEEFTVVQLGDADGVSSEADRNLANKDYQKTSSTSSSGSLSAATKNQKKTMKTKKEKTTAKSGKGAKTAAPSSSSSQSRGKGGADGSKDSTSKKKLQGLLVLRPRSVVVAASSGDDDGVVGGSDDRGNGVSTSIGVALPPLIIGRSSKQNDRVSFEVAKDHHLWFHVQGSPGSHCLLQLDPGDKGRATEECLQYAADVAAYYSQARGSTQVPVGYTSPKYVKRISGGAPGMVSIMQQQGMVYGRPSRGKEFVEKYGPSGHSSSPPF